MALPHVIVIGGGFGGMQAVLALRNAPVRITLIDRSNHYLFQPLLYQVATGGLSPANISAPFRAMLKKQRNVEVVLGSVDDVDVDRHEIVMSGQRQSYDTLIVATGSQVNFFGKDQWANLTVSLKSAKDAVSIRNRVLFTFEQVEREPAIEHAPAWMTFVIIGGGPTGVELAGALGELKTQTLKGEYHHVDPAAAKVILLEAKDRILPTFPPNLSKKADESLQRLGITICTSTLVTEIEPDKVTARVKDTYTRVLEARTIIWTAGVRGSALGQRIAQAAGAEVDRNERIVVQPDLSLPGHPEILIVGDLADYRHQTEGQPLPALSPVAIQQGRYAAHLIQARMRGETLPPFRYHDRGTMATVGRGAAVVDLKWVRFDGWLGWMAWLFIHLLYIVQFENKLLILIQWAWNYFTRNRSARLITDQPSEMDKY